jgi:hypothetical protein
LSLAERRNRLHGAYRLPPTAAAAAVVAVVVVEQAVKFLFRYRTS